MHEKYNYCISQRNNIFAELSATVPAEKSSKNEDLDKGISWVPNGTDTVLDFGCGNGTMLLLCALNGTKKHNRMFLLTKKAGMKKPYSWARLCIMPLHTTKTTSL